MPLSRALLRGGAVFFLLALAGGAFAQGEPVPPEVRPPCADRDPHRRPFFGDLHVHTVYSQDASTLGTRATPVDAYRFARGEALGIQPYDENGKPRRTIQLKRPLDFTAITDHAEQYGETHICRTPGLPGHGSWVCRLYRAWPRAAFFVMNAGYSYSTERWSWCGEGGELCLDAASTVWQRIQEAAEGAYDRSEACKFTSFVGYEWTSVGHAGGHLHRNVVFRNHNTIALPISQMDTGNSGYELLKRLSKACPGGSSGCDFITIPHNSNLSAGSAFSSALNVGEAITPEEIPLRERYERLVEVMQHKGDSECFLFGDTTDEACGFEKTTQGAPDDLGFLASFVTEEEAPDQRPNMVREALKRGLALEGERGGNPFHFGLIGSTDTHLAAPGFVDEKDFQGHGGAGKVAVPELPVGLIESIGYNPGGLAVLWAEENTRDALFDAMLRREAYGTSGTRPTLRFFGGWNYPKDLCSAPDRVARGYAGGVPMGGTLPADRGAAEAPVFVVSALRDSAASASPLQRLEIIKGWQEGGELRERVLDVAGGDNGARVDLRTCERSGPQTASLCAVWSDPDFDPKERAFYYARLRENPSCRWSQWACVEAGVDCSAPSTIGEGFEACCAPEHQPTIQERAWSSPIWYEPPSVARASAQR